MSRTTVAVLAGLAFASAARAQEQPAHTTLVTPPFAHTLGVHRARPVHLRLFLGDRTDFDDPQGLAAVKFDADDDPERRGDDYQLTLFGVNSGRGEVIYNSSMQTLAVYGHEGGGEGAFQRPHGIAAVPDGRVYVADTGNRRLVRLRFDPDTRSLRWVGAWPVEAPHDVDVDYRGQAWVTDRGTDGVLRFADSSAGAGTRFLEPSPIDGARWPLPDDVVDPVSLAIGDSLDPWYAPSWYRLYLVDRDGARLRAYDAEGAVVAEVRPRDVHSVVRGSAPERFFYLALDYYGHVWTTDPASGLVVKLSPDLEPLTAFPGPGPDEPLEGPRGIAIWKRFGQVFIAEREGASYFFVGTDVEVPPDGLVVHRSPSGRTLATELFLTEPAHVTARFLDERGEAVGVADLGVVESGRHAVRWSTDAWTTTPGPGDLDRAVEVALEARPTYSSRKRFRRVRVVPLRWGRES